MNILFETLVQLVITSKVIAISFESLIKSLPADVPDDVKAMMLDMHQKHPEEFTMPDLDDVTSMDFKTASPVVTTPTEKDPDIVRTTTAKRKKVTKTNKGVTSGRKMLRTAATEVSLQYTSELPDIKTTTKLPEAGTQHTIPPPSHQITTPPMPVPVPMPMPMPIYARVPIMMPMRSYFEPVIHDHPPLYKIKEMIEKDEKKWKKENKGKDCDVSVEIAYSDEDTDSDSDSDSSSESVDVGSDYYSDFMKITANRNR